MEITIQKVNQSVITLEFLQNLEQEVDDITPLVTSLEKLQKIVNKTGFSNKFNRMERVLWNDIFDKVLPLKQEEDEAPKD